jgi:hypothetical protein
MRGDILFQNVFVLFILAIILESSVMAILTITALKKFSESDIGKTIRDVVILLLALFVCWKVRLITLFGGTGINVPAWFDTIISGLVVSRIANLIRDLVERIKENS